MQISFWTVVTDFGIMSAIILFSQLLRAKVKVFQKFFIPAALIAGFIGLILGPNGYKLIPFSSIFGSYPGVLIVLVFATLPIGQEKIDLKQTGEGIGNIWSYSLVTYIGQHFLAMVLGLLLFIPLFKTHPGFAFMLPAGFVGGHGTAAAVGISFKGLGWEEAASLGMTSATVGILTGLIGGIIIINWATKVGATKYLKEFSELPKSFKTGLLEKEERLSMGYETFSPITVDPLAVHVGLILFVSISAKYIADIVLKFYPKLSLPIFTLAVVVGYIAQLVLNKTGGSKYIDKRVVTRIGSACTDYLVAFGVASIQLPVVIKYAVPLAVLFIFGILFVVLEILYIGPRFFKKCWFEKSIFTFGWATGVTAIGLTLLRVADPEFKSKTLDDFSFGYLFGTMPAELLVVTFAPIAIANGLSIQYTAVLFVVLLIVLAISWKAKWFYSMRRKPDADDKAA